MRNRSLAPDLFSTATDMAPPSSAVSRSEPQPVAIAPRYVLPNNLLTALSHLTDQELDRLIESALTELDQRGRKQRPSGGRRIKQRTEHAAAPALTQGKLNAVRAAFKAGVKPSQIARQFGIAQSDVRRVIRVDT